MEHPVTKIMLAAALMAVPVLVNAQPSVNDPKTPVEGGDVLMRPMTDPQAVRPSPGNVDPAEVNPAPDNVPPGTPTQAQTKAHPKRAAQKERGTKRAQDADCPGAAASCKPHRQ